MANWVLRFLKHSSKMQNTLRESLEASNQKCHFYVKTIRMTLSKLSGVVMHFQFIKMETEIACQEAHSRALEITDIQQLNEFIMHSHEQKSLSTPVRNNSEH